MTSYTTPIEKKPYATFNAVGSVRNEELLLPLVDGKGESMADSGICLRVVGHMRVCVGNFLAYQARYQYILKALCIKRHG